MFARPFNRGQSSAGDYIGQYSSNSAIHPERRGEKSHDRLFDTRYGDANSRINTNARRINAESGDNSRSPQRHAETARSVYSEGTSNLSCLKRFIYKLLGLHDPEPERTSAVLHDQTRQAVHDHRNTVAVSIHSARKTERQYTELQRVANETIRKLEAKKQEEE
jgi:hypothetical protein